VRVSTAGGVFVFAVLAMAIKYDEVDLEKRRRRSF
jgi:hypothetical protein